MCNGENLKPKPTVEVRYRPTVEVRYRPTVEARYRNQQKCYYVYIVNKTKL
tara:strand:+ start:576 stop:728 length:153 start_codon:yes stop_codon:yes gene_type:complete